MLLAGAKASVSLCTRRRCSLYRAAIYVVPNVCFQRSPELSLSRLQRAWIVAADVKTVLQNWAILLGPHRVYGCCSPVDSPAMPTPIWDPFAFVGLELNFFRVIYQPELRSY